jgi:hypothetical protein
MLCHDDVAETSIETVGVVAIRNGVAKPTIAVTEKAEARSGGTSLGSTLTLLYPTRIVWVEYE